MNEQTYRSEPDLSNITASLAYLNKWSIQLVEKKQDIHQQLNDIDQTLKNIEDAKLTLTKLFDSDPPPGFLYQIHKVLDHANSSL